VLTLRFSILAGGSGNTCLFPAANTVTPPLAREGTAIGGIDDPEKSKNTDVEKCVLIKSNQIDLFVTTKHISSTK